jgi:3',5'-cyclic AMP phosphodiesterase CpdA
MQSAPEPPASPVAVPSVGEPTAGPAVPIRPVAAAPALFRLAHLSDPHLAPLPQASPWQLASKRVTGFLSWNTRRKHIHISRALEAVCADIRRGGFDHIVVTGDIANIALPGEFDVGARFLAALGSPHDVSVVPGNHDTYVNLPWAQGLAKWNAYMTGDDAAAPDGIKAFPYLRRRGPVGIVGLNTGEPEAWFLATGRLGQEQIARCEEMLAALGREGLFRLVLIHHPPQPGGAPWRKSLLDARAFREMIGRVGAELIVHGHMHRPMLGRILGPRGPVPVLGVAAASSDVTSYYGAGGYHAISISRANDAWSIDVEVRQLATDYASCKAQSQFRLALPLAA